MKTKLFVSSTLTNDHSFQQFCSENNILLTAQSLIDFKPLPFELNEDYDVIFFSSPRSFNYFIRFASVSPSALIAVIGNGTANFINDKVSSIDFIGNRSGKPDEVASAFKSWLGKRKVLFPLALHSNESVSSMIPAEQKIEIRVYETILSPTSIAPQDWYVFTSPSNVISFFEKNQLAKASKIIAWGKTTENELTKRNIPVYKTLDESAFAELVRFFEQEL